MDKRLRGIVTVVVVVLLAAAAGPGVADAQLNITGQWSTLPYLAPINPIHVALLKNGKVLIIAGSENNENNTVYKTAVWDPVAGSFSQQTTPWDLFCNGMSFLPDGRVIMTGGNLQYDPFYGPPWTTIFDPATAKFYRVEDMASGRWYPSNSPMADGGTFTFGGDDGEGVPNKTAEIYDVGGGWSPPYQANFSPMWYPRLHLLGNGNIFMSGPNPGSHTFNPSTGTWSNVSAVTNYGDARIYGSSVLLPLHPDDGYKPGVVIFGGNLAGATDTVEYIDLGTWPEAWVNMPPMSKPRVTMNAVLLPSGKILTFGGSTNFNDPATAHLNAETFDPVATTWTPSGNMSYARLYHSSALLLPDATVWVAGSNPNRETWTPQMEIYKPPYLFTSSGALASRPTISSAPAVVGYGQTFTVNTPNAAGISQVVLMRPGSNTHAFDVEQRLIHMYFAKGSGTLSVTAPTKQGAAPPGYYMLFIIDGNGVPSMAKFLQLMPNPTNQPPTATITNPSADLTIAAGQSVTFAGSASDPDGSVALYAWIFPGGSPGKSNAPNPGAVTFATPGVYTVSLTVLDDLGVNNPSPPTVTVTVTAGGAPALGASITSPASGATVSGTVTVGMAASNVEGSPTQFVLKLDNSTTLSTQSISSGTTASYSWNTTTTTDGTHTLNLTVTDGAGRTATAAVTVTVANSSPPPPGEPQNVVWTSPVNVAVSGNTITKSGGCNGCYDAGAISQQTIGSGDGSVEFTVSGSAYVAAGLSNGNPGTSAQEIKWALWFKPNGYVEVRESGAWKWDYAVVAGAVHKIAVEGGVVKYYQNGTLKYTSAVLPTYPLLLDAAIGTTGAAVQSAVITTGSSTGGDTTPPTVTVTAPASGATVSGTITVSATASDNVGVTAVQFKLNGANLGTADTTAPYSISWNTTTVPDGSYTLTATATDAANNAATSAPVTVTVANGSPPPGGPQNVVWTSAVNVTVSDNTITKSAGCNGCYDAGAISQQTIASGDGSVEFTVSSSAYVAVGLSSGNPGTSAQEIKWALWFKPSGYVEVRESGVWKSDYALVAGAVHKIAVEGGVVKYYQNGTLKFTSAVAAIYPLLLDAAIGTTGAAVQSAVITTGSGDDGGTPPPPPSGPANVVWTSPVNVAVSDNTITKSGGCNGCYDAGAISQQTIGSGDGSVEFTVSSSAYVAVGLSNGNPGTTAQEIKWALWFKPSGYVEVRESGAWKWDYAAVAGAVHTIAVEGGAVKYYQNGTLKYTSAVLPTYPLLLDAAIGTTGAAVQSAVITTP